MSAFEHTIESVVRGFHVYKAIWVPVLDEVLQAKQEFDNEEDQYAVAVVKTTPSTTGRPDKVNSWTCSKKYLENVLVFHPARWRNYMQVNRTKKAVRSTSRRHGSTMRIQIYWQKETY